MVRRPNVLLLGGYLLCQLGVVLAFLTAADPAGSALVNVIGDLVTLAFAVAGVMLSGRDRLIGAMAVGSIALLTAGDELARRITGPDGETPFPASPDIPFALGTLLLGALFVTVAVRTRGGPAGAWLDTALASAGLVIVAVQFGLVQALQAGSGPAVGLSLLYAGIDLVGIVVAIWCLVSGRAITVGLGLVAGCCTLWYLTDLSYAVLNLTGRYISGGVLDLGWYLANAMLAWSCWTGISSGRDRARPGMGHSRRLLLAGAVGLLGPVGLIVASAFGIEVSRLALAASTVLPLVLALARMHGLLRRLEHQAGHDHLTGLLSRAEFTRRAEHDLAAGRVRAVLVIDVDGFKRVNDTFGHSAGDAVLVAVAGRLTAWAPDGSVLGRLGGDEFAVVLPHRLARFGPGGDVDPHLLAPFLEVQVVAPSGTGGLGPDESGADAPGPGAGGWWVTVSVGVADLGSDQGAADRAGRAEWTLDAVLAEADGQMYRQKAGSRSRRLADPPAVRTGADDPSAGVRS